MKMPETATDNNVGRKTPEEIKKGLRTAKHVQCMEISDDDENCGTHYGVLIGYVLRDKIFAYIQQLESRLAQVERERDAMLLTLKEIGCGMCKHAPSQDDIYIHNECLNCLRRCNFEWRGPCSENTKEERK